MLSWLCLGYNLHVQAIHLTNQDVPVSNLSSHRIFLSALLRGADRASLNWFTVLIPGDENILPKFKRDPWLANAWHKNKLTLQSDAFAIAKAVHPHPLLLWASNSPGCWSHDSWGGKTMLVDYFSEPTLKF